MISILFCVDSSFISSSSSSSVASPSCCRCCFFRILSVLPNTNPPVGTIAPLSNDPHDPISIPLPSINASAVAARFVDSRVDRVDSRNASDLALIRFIKPLLAFSARSSALRCLYLCCDSMSSFNFFLICSNESKPCWVFSSIILRAASLTSLFASSSNTKSSNTSFGICNLSSSTRRESFHSDVGIIFSSFLSLFSHTLS
mmetsp:Transcript_4697/g.5419  ORF Transcript_4697/g.5419 Transcript_4697/m.5419 type:complete len:201 (-) Transcript_4697:376-978(-)